NPRNRGGSTGHVLAKRSVTFTEIRNYIELDTESCIAKLINQAFAHDVLEPALCSMHSDVE
ncbi:hypothetical protein, partial [Pseudomonas aeruginosa]|uniref:hypothetical protein n=1 Tax=Pseudomonas aeruginosa TaxID=287 RepID=UPI003CC5F676